MKSPGEYRSDDEELSLLGCVFPSRPCPAQCIWQGSGFAADQTNAMLAVAVT